MILRNKFVIAIFILPVYLSLILSSAQAFTVGDIEFSEEYSFGEIKIRLNAAAPMTFLYSKMAAVGLYLQKDIKPNQVFEDFPKRIEVAYLQSIGREKMVKFTNESIVRNIGSKNFQRLKQDIDVLNTLFDDVRSGDRISITYLPGVGTKIEYNGIPSEVIKGLDFANAVFSIYVGINPASHRTKSILLRDKSQYKL